MEPPDLSGRKPNSEGTSLIREFIRNDLNLKLARIHKRRLLEEHSSINRLSQSRSQLNHSIQSGNPSPLNRPRNLNAIKFVSVNQSHAQLDSSANRNYPVAESPAEMTTKTHAMSTLGKMMRVGQISIDSYSNFSRMFGLLGDFKEEFREILDRNGEKEIAEAIKQVNVTAFQSLIAHRTDTFLNVMNKVVGERFFVHDGREEIFFVLMKAASQLFEYYRDFILNVERMIQQSLGKSTKANDGALSVDINDEICALIEANMFLFFKDPSLAVKGRKKRDDFARRLIETRFFLKSMPKSDSFIHCLDTIEEFIRMTEQKLFDNKQEMDNMARERERLVSNVSDLTERLKEANQKIVNLTRETESLRATDGHHNDDMIESYITGTLGKYEQEAKRATKELERFKVQHTKLLETSQKMEAVSYTHLTLPTIYSV
eukprot:TRINITY_DN6633_c0_g1_i2.p1 TRINITY_DN6633_c0_g1~~TRINITY_DN6633_c0_g1_i2.p1  ORF type:complete len:431 (-),score=112.02 TRINITY_DN6633_c0_g1_i2:40-1332(-)